ncbi:MAG: GTP 3',8-cyclase MoaA [Synergistaceae bacterium]|jgi:cyclic pyranopterin phosphate synthase|nr:GTP 3',8-cyclase MoaA [Synergistaceae bacterium]
MISDGEAHADLTDFFGRKLNYVRISVTDRCNYRCRYCMPKDGVEWIPHDRIMTYEDIFFLIRVLRELGVEKARFTGGEPLVRRGMVSFLSDVRASFPGLRVALTTNGSTLSLHAPELVRMGLSSINVSLDTLDAEKFAFMTRGASLGTVLGGLEALLDAGALSAGTDVKMNAVLIRGFNDGEAGGLIDFARRLGIVLRFIEFMPLDRTLWSEESFIPFHEILTGLPDASEWRPEASGPVAPAGPARYYVNGVTGQRIGVIAAVSEHFCASCNRLRVTSTGELRACLFSNEQVSIFGPLRARDEAALRERLFEAAVLKPEAGMGLNRNEERRMSMIGG